MDRKIEQSQFAEMIENEDEDAISESEESQKIIFATL